MGDAVLRSSGDKLEHFCFRLCRDEGRAEDMTQEVFLPCAAKPCIDRELYVRSVQKPGCLPPPPICTVTRCAGQPRGSSCWRRSARDPSWMPLDETAADALERVDLNSLLEQLPPEDRQLFLLRVPAGWNATQLGQQLSYRQPPSARTGLGYPGPPATRNGGLNV